MQFKSGCKSQGFFNSEVLKDDVVLHHVAGIATEQVLAQRILVIEHYFALELHARFHCNSVTQ